MLPEWDRNLLSIHVDLSLTLAPLGGGAKGPPPVVFRE